MKIRLKRIGALLLAMVFVFSMVQLRARAEAAHDGTEVTVTNTSDKKQIKVKLHPNGGTIYTDAEPEGSTDPVELNIPKSSETTIEIVPEDSSHFLVGWVDKAATDEHGPGMQIYERLEFDKDQNQPLYALWAVITLDENSTEIVISIKGADLDIQMTYNEDGTITVNASYTGTNQDHNFLKKMDSMCQSMSGNYDDFEDLQESLGNINGAQDFAALVNVVSETAEIANDTYVEATAFYTIETADLTGGSIEIGGDVVVTDGVPTAKANDTVTLTVEPEEGFEVDSVTYTYTIGENEPTTVEVEEDEDGYSFEMPAANVTVSATFKAIEYTVEIDDEIENGSVEADKETAGVGDTVILTVEPEEGFEVDSVTYTPEGGDPVEIEAVEGAYSFDMPAADVLVSATFKAIEYNITIITNTAEGGTVSSSRETAAAGEWVYVEFFAAEGYEITSIVMSYMDEGEPYEDEFIGDDYCSDYTWAEEMSASDITFTVTFTAIKYTVEIDDEIENGSVEADKETAGVGDTVILTMESEEGFEVDSVTYTYAIGEYESTTKTVDPVDGVYSFDMPAADVLVSATFKAIPVTAPRFARHSMILDEQIGVRFELILPEDFVVSEDMAVEFKVSDGRTESVLLTDVGPDENGDLWFVCHINALELADTITATFVWGDGEDEIATDTYSAVQYFEYFEDNEETPVKLSDLLEALQDYGHYMYESEWQDADGNGGLREKSDHVKIENANKNADALINAAMVWLNGNGIDDPDFSDVGAGIADVKFSLTLNSATKINLFVRMEDSVTLNTQPDGELTIGGEVYSWIEGAEIKASALTVPYTFNIETSEGPAEIRINPMQYLKLMLENDAVLDENRAALAAFVVYAYSALEYYNSIS